VFGVSVWNGATYERALWIGADSFARVTWTGGQIRDFTNEAILAASDDCVVRTFGLEVPSGTRVNVAGSSADVVETAGY
jgi:hypothetical protein